MMKDDRHTFKGMGRSTHQIRQDSSLLWDAYNINLEEYDNDTRFSITNLKKDEEVTIIDKGNLGMSYYGSYVGHCVIGDYLVVFTAKRSSFDPSNGYCSYILRIKKTGDTLTCEVLFSTISFTFEGWNPDNPIEALGVIESDKIIKVYWVDGVHQPRMINILQPELKEFLGEKVKYTGSAGYYECYNDLTGFDFCPAINLNETISVKKEYGNGSFSPGVIQYAFSYYYLHGQETCIFNYTHLLYISYKDRGANSDEVVSNSFKITLENVDTNFDGIKVYSIQRTSIDGTPIVKLVGNIEINKNSSTYTFIDNGTKGESVDENLLLYLGGDFLIANTLTSKSNTLFLGNISTDNFNIRLRNKFKTFIYNTDYTLEPFIGGIDVSINAYDYNPDLDNNIAGFKANEFYRIGFQVQNNTGKWSDPLFICKTTVKRLYPFVGKSSVVARLSGDIARTLKEFGGKRIRACAVFPRFTERYIMCQGVLNSTVFNGKSRATGDTFSLSSWFFRPFNSGATLLTFSSNGSSISNNFFQPIQNSDYPGAEIQNSKLKNNNISIGAEEYTYNEVTNNFSSTFFVDTSIVTMHSPDIEFSNELDYEKGATLNIIGYYELTSVSGTYNIISGPKNSDSSAGILSSQNFLNNLPVNSYINTGMSSYPLYSDNGIKTDYSSFDNIYNYIVYPWHRSGSLNNDTRRPDDKGAQTAILKSKQLFNIKYFRARKYTPTSLFNSISVKINCFNGTPIKINTLEGSGSYGSNKTYLGEVDLLNATTNQYPIKVLSTANNSPEDLPYSGGVKYSRDPVRIKYKSTKHLVFSLTDGVYGLYQLYGDTKTSINLPSWTMGDKPTDVESQTYDFILYGIMKNRYDAVVSDSTNGQVVWEVSDSGNQGLAIIRTGTYDNFGYFNNGDTIKLLAVNNKTYIGSGIEPSNYELTVNDKGLVNNGSYIFTVKYEDKKVQQISKIAYQIQEQENRNYDKNSIFNFNDWNSIKRPFLALAELVNTNNNKDINGYIAGDNGILDTGEDNSNISTDYLWTPASDPISIQNETSDGHIDLRFIYGDTWYSRYNCLKTYPYTLEDENSVIEIGSFMCETRVNLDAFTDRNRGNYPLFSASPDNFNTRNPVYEQKDNFFPNRILDKTLYETNKFPTQVVWSQEKHNASEVDEWTNISLASPLDLPGDKGNLTALKTYRDTILAFQDKSISVILFNNRVQIPVSDGVPIEITNGMKVQGYKSITDSIGCQYKWSICQSDNALYFIDKYNSGLYRLKDINNIENIGQTHGIQWILNAWNDKDYDLRLFSDYVTDNVYIYPAYSWYYNSDEVGLPYYGLYFSEKLDSFISRIDIPQLGYMFNFNEKFYSITDNLGIYKPFSSDKRYSNWSITFISNPEAAIVKIFDTIELHADLFDDYGQIGERVSHNEYTRHPFNYINVTNEYQSTGTIRGEINTIDGRLREKFRTWRMHIPRSGTGRDRILNTWAEVQLSGSKLYNKETKRFDECTNPVIIHDINVRYSV